MLAGLFRCRFYNCPVYSSLDVAVKLILGGVHAQSLIVFLELLIIAFVLSGRYGELSHRLLLFLLFANVLVNKPVLLRNILVQTVSEFFQSLSTV